MTNKQFEAFCKAFRRKQDKLIKCKGYDYTQGNKDRLYNFKFVAKQLGLTPLQVWSVYWLKHVLAILTFIKTGGIKSEGIQGRFLDESNYNLLGLSLLHETKKLHRRRRDKRKKKT